ncbi:MAG TPA: hemerythrin domain-containing protein [Ignavibacteriaceae bacterium]|nr:hemerythrin domain-containing protein [Ignavibacteriaceae bacterium]
MESDNRRQFLKSGFIIAGAAIFNSDLFAKPERMIQEMKEEEVSPNEDLMREHGVLKRVLLIYQEILDRVYSKKDFSADTVVDSANIIRKFIEDYHEKLEEDYLFPRLKKANTQVELVDILTTQHQRGRIITDKILSLAKNNFKSDDDKKQLRSYLYSFIRMYSPHEAREDTILFPAFKKIVSKNEYDSLGEEFEEKEHKLFGEDGFEVMVNKVEEIEKKLDIYNLSRFTPKI